MTTVTPTVTNVSTPEPRWSPWRVSSGANGKRTWWINRDKVSPYVQESYDTADGRLRQYLTREAAQKVADKLNLKR